MGAYLTGFVCVFVLCSVIALTLKDVCQRTVRHSNLESLDWLVSSFCVFWVFTRPTSFSLILQKKSLTNKGTWKALFKNFYFNVCLLTFSFSFPSLTSSSQASITRISATVLNLSLRRLVCDAGYRHRLGRLHHSERHGALPHPLPEPPQPHPQHVHHQQWDWRHCYGGSRPGQRGQCKLCVLCSRYLHRGFTLHLICVHAIKQLWRFGYVIHV